MKTRVLFFDDEPQMGREMAQWLSDSNYAICSPLTKEEAFQEINSNGAELLVYVSSKNKTNFEKVDGIFRQYPRFPSIQVSIDQSEGSRPLPQKGPFHQKLRPLSSKKDFLKRVRKLIFLGRMSRQNEALNRTVKLQNQVDHIFESLDYNKLKQTSVDFFAAEFKATNAYFLSTGGYGYYINEMWKVVPASPLQSESLPQKHALCSAGPSTEAELSRILNQISPSLPAGWELKHKRTFVKRQNGAGNSVCLVPLVGNRSKTVLGHIVLVEPVLYGDTALDKVLPHLTRVLGRHLEHAINYAEAKSLTYIDDLTSLYNQRYLKLVLDKEIIRAARGKSTFSVLFMDIDHFKLVNDNKGHLVGSKVLVEISKILGDQLRATDYGFRYGGDEFILILVGSDCDQSLIVAERIRKQVEASTFEMNGTKINVTLSIGIANYPGHAKTKDEIIELADRAMYCGKNKSRNVVYVAS